MKKLLLLLSAFALVMGLSQCRKPNMPVLNAGETQHVVLNASWDNGGSKIVQDGTGLKWNEGDKLYVNQGDESIGTLICKDPDNGTFEGYIRKVDGKITFTFRGANYKENFMEQTGNLDDAVLLKSEELKYKSDGNYGNVSMTMPHAVLLLDLSALGAEGGTKVTIKADNTEVASVEGVKTDSENVYVAFPVEKSKDAKIYEFVSSIGSARCKGWELNENTFYTLTGGTGQAIVVTPSSPELLTGKFSVSATEYAQFSRGNLYCTDNGTSASPRYTFNFERNQYDFRHRPGKGSMLNGVFSTSSGTPANTSGSFQWNVSAAVPGQDYGAFGTTYPGTPADDAMIDWGQAIGGNWYTMTKEEMSYLIGYGTLQRPNYENLRKVSKIDFSGFSVNGFVLAPDNYDFTSHPLRSSYSESEWGQAEQDYGLVFLPCAGFNYDAWAVGVTGRYYASNHPGNHLYFGDNGENYIGSSDEYHCMSMRLVQKFDKSEIEPTFVDLGLPSGTLWANMNVGAMSETDYGYYLAWGEKSVHYTSANPATGSFVWKSGLENGYQTSTYYFYDGAGYTKYNTTDNIRLLQNEDDICFELYGSSCSVPSYSQWIELQNYCTKTWKGNGYEFVGTNGKKIFLPVNGFVSGTTISQYDNNGGYYWSNELKTISEGYSWHFGGSNDFWYSEFSRSWGLGIRAVKVVAD